MKTILHICEAFEGGQFYYIAQLCNALAGEFKFVVLYGPGRKALPVDFKREFPEGTEFIAWTNAQRELRPAMDWKALKEARDFIEQIRPDVVHCHSSKGGALARVAALRSETPVIYTPNSYAFLRRDISPVKRAIYTALEYTLGRFPHITVAAGEAEFRDALKLARKAYFISNTVPRADAHYPDPQSSKPLIAVMSGRITAQKNFPLYCAIAEAAKDLNVKFTWIGGSEEFDSSGVPENLEVTGWVSRDIALDIVINADVYVQTASWEGLPLTVLEAMTLGKPILATNIAPNRELVLQGENGYICQNKVDFVSRLRELEFDRSQGHRMGQRSRSIVELRYDREYAIAYWRSVYNNYDSYYNAL